MLSGTDLLEGMKESIPSTKSSHLDVIPMCRYAASSFRWAAFIPEAERNIVLICCSISFTSLIYDKRKKKFLPAVFNVDISCDLK